MCVRKKIDLFDYSLRYVMFDAINQRHFKGELPRPEISFENLDEYRYGDAIAAFCQERYGVPTIILAWNEDKISDLETFAVALAHEMIHYYNYLHKTKDVDIHGYIQFHNEAFRNAAKVAELLDADFISSYCDENGNLLDDNDWHLWGQGYHDCIAIPDIDYSIYDNNSLISLSDG